MKKLLLILLCLPMIGFGQIQLFDVDSSSKIVATLNPNNTIGLKLNEKEMNRIITLREDSFLLNLPFFGSNIILNLEKYQPYADAVQTTLKTSSGDKNILITPQLLSYKLIYNGKSIGILNFVNNQINATFLIDNKQYEISEYKNRYVLFDINNSINQSTFSCNVNQQINSLPNTGIMNTQVLPVCVELAIEIDNHTRNTFSTDQETLDWALAIISGVSQVYQAQTNAEIRVVHNTIWNVVDPYDTCTSVSSVLYQERDYWIANNSAINRDLVHFMSKRYFTGFSGIAFINVLCNNNSGYGVSSGLSNDTTFTFPNPSYSGNLSLISHEIGHNFGSKHTHWCGWNADPLFSFPGGVIDNCTDVEGSCPNNPLSQLGTIMSYCWPKVIAFHDIVVSQALDIGIANASCLTACIFYGCTDPLAYNYDSLANTDDGSCCFIAGCMDTIAINYNATACYDDGSCIIIISAINETTNTDRKLLRITDVLGQETPQRRNTPLFYIYDDGTVEKRIVIE